MNIQKVSYTSNSKSSQSFKGLHVTNPKVQKLLLKSLDNKQIETLSNIVKNQENNSVHILLDSKNGQTLNASFFCPYRIKNFKTEYRYCFETIIEKLSALEKNHTPESDYTKSIKSLCDKLIFKGFDMLAETYPEHGFYIKNYS